MLRHRAVVGDMCRADMCRGATFRSLSRGDLNVVALLMSSSIDGLYQEEARPADPANGATDRRGKVGVRVRFCRSDTRHVF